MSSLQGIVASFAMSWPNQANYAPATDLSDDVPAEAAAWLRTSLRTSLRVPRTMGRQACGVVCHAWPDSSGWAWDVCRSFGFLGCSPRGSASQCPTLAGAWAPGRLHTGIAPRRRQFAGLEPSAQSRSSLPVFRTRPPVQAPPARS